MYEPQQLNRTVIRDVIAYSEAGDTIKDIMNAIKYSKDYIKAANHTSKLQTGSIARRASQLVLVFPVLVSSSLTIETAIMISKAIERKCVALLQLLFSAVNLTEYRNTQDLYDYISKFHTNLNSNGYNISLDDFIFAMDQMATKHEGVEIIDKGLYDTIHEQLRGINIPAKDILNEYSVNDFHIDRNLYGDLRVTLEADGDNESGESQNTQQQQQSNEKKSASRKDPHTDFDKQVMNTGEVSKANELMPTTMVVNFMTTIDGQVVNRSGMIGVKAKIYPVEQHEIFGRLSSKYSDSHTFYNLIRCSIKEKSFFKDFLFAFDKLKRDAINTAKGGINSKLWRLLERRADRNRSKLFNGSDPSPITTLVISQDDAEYLKKYCSMDIEKPNISRVVFDGFNLMGLVIADNSTEVARFLWDDGDGTFESISYKALSKESKDDDYKKIVNLMTKINR